MAEGRPWTIVVLPRAATPMKRLPSTERTRITSAIDRLAFGPRAGGAKPLHGRDEWTLRVGERRVLFRIDESKRTIVVTAVGARGDVYKR